MAQDPQRQGVFRFGVFELDPRSGELRKNGVKLRLQEQPLQVLLMLVERPGDVVTREELRERLWPDGTFVDFDKGVNTAIQKLREVLDDSATTPRFVETVPRRGYRFIYPIEAGAAVRESADARLAVPGSPGTPAPRPGRMLLIGSVAGSLAMLAAGVGYFLNDSEIEADAEPLTPVRLTTSPGKEASPSFSPDGNQVAFTWNGDNQNNFDIYVKTVGQSGHLRLTDDPRAEYSPAWSPDGRWIAFLRDNGQRAEIRLVASLGGPSRRVAEVLAPARMSGTADVPRRRLSWHPAGTALVMGDRASLSSDPGSLFLVSAESGEKKELLAARGETKYLDRGVFSPDGRAIAFNGGSGPFVRPLSVVRLSQDLSPVGEQRTLSPGTPAVSGFTWMPHGEELVYGFFPNGSLWRVSADGSGKPDRLPFSGDRDSEPTLSARGDRLAFVRDSTDRNIWRLDLASPGGPAVSAAPVITSTASDTFPRFSPDGERIAFSSRQSGVSELWVCEKDGSNAIRLTDFGLDASAGSPRWSPDGREIALDYFTREVWVVNADGGAKREILRGSQRGIIPSWSRDMAWMYFGSDRSGTFEIWKIPTESGEAVRVTRNGGFGAEESGDGRFLYYTKRDRATGLWRIPVDGGDEERVLESVSSHINFTVAPEGVYYIPLPEPGANPEVRFLRFATGEDTLVKPLDKPVHSGLSLSPDGRSLLYVQVDREGSDLMLVENFR